MHAKCHLPFFAFALTFLLLLPSMASTAFANEARSAVGWGSYIDNRRDQWTQQPDGEARRPSLLFLGADFEGSAASELSTGQQDELIANIRDALEGSRFDLHSDFAEAASARQRLNRDRFINGFANFLQTHADEIAADRLEDAGRDYNFEFRDFIISGEAMDQVLDSAYVYELRVHDIETYVGRPQYGGAAVLDFFRRIFGVGADRHVAHLTFDLTFYRLDIPDDMNESPQLIEVEPGTMAIVAEGSAPRTSSEDRAIQRAVDNVDWRLDDLIRRIPAFQLTTTLDQDADENWIIPFGEHEQVKLDDYYEVVERHEDGSERRRGWMKVRHVGPGLVAGDVAGATLADDDPSHLRPISGSPEHYMFVREFAMMGLNIDASFYSSFDAIGDGPGFTGFIGLEDEDFTTQFGASVFFNYNLGREIGVPDLWIGAAADLGFGGSTRVDEAVIASQPDLTLLSLSASFRIKKKFYLGRFVVAPVGFFGFQVHYMGGDTADLLMEGNGGDPNSSPRSKPLPFGGGAIRFSYFLHPRWELFIEGGVRVGASDNEIVIPGGVNIDDDEFSWHTTGLIANVGLSILF